MYVKKDDIELSQGGGMLVKTIRKPGQKGTKKLVKEYGDKLICVRYRYDYQAKKKIKTAEIIIESTDWVPEKNWTEDGHEYGFEPAQTTPWVGVKIHFQEKDLQKAVKSIGGYWDISNRLWFAPEYQVHQIGLQERIVSKKGTI